MQDQISGMGYGVGPCTNCESEPKREGDTFCSDECKAEYEGEEDPPQFDATIDSPNYWRY